MKSLLLSIFMIFVGSLYVTPEDRNLSGNSFFFDLNPGALPDGVNLLENPDLIFRNGKVEGWQLIRNNRSNAAFSSDGQSLVIKSMYYDRMAQKITLTKGHYMFRAMVKADIFPIHAYVSTPTDQHRIPAGISGEFRWVELPFYVNGPDETNQVEAGLMYCVHPGGTGMAARHTTDLYIKKMELIRLGDTNLPYRWARTFTADLHHGLKTILEDPQWDRPGRVIFKDSFLGTELWMMSQGGQTDMSYVGLPDFSSDGKYLQVGHRRPGYVMRTDGTSRYKPASGEPDQSWTWKILWPYPFEERRVPQGTNPSDWIVTSRDFTAMEMHNLSTGKSHKIIMPSRQGWQIIHYPSISTHGGRGPDIRNINYETLVWQSDDKKYIGLSDIEGENFRSFMIKSISSQPDKDEVHPSGPKDEPIMSSGGKGGDNWRNAVDRNGNRYFIFEINRGRDSNDQLNPYQVWAICLSGGDTRGLLRVVHKPGLEKIIPDTARYSLLWWEFSALHPWSGDNAMFLLEDGTYLHMSSLGMHSGFPGTVSSQDPYSNTVSFIASYPKNTGSADRISWPHEFRHDRDYAILEANTDAAPFGPFVMIDLEHKTLWTLVLSNYHDYEKRYQQRPMYKGRPGFGEYNRPMFRHAPTPSPDFTKVTYCSSMLTGDSPERIWGDAYIAVARYPQPPVNIRFADSQLSWDKPKYHREIKGYNIYRSNESGDGKYSRINENVIEDTRYILPTGKKQRTGFYVITSVEHSGLESRDFSDEAAVGKKKIRRLFCQAEDGKLTSPMVPFFEPSGAANSYAVAVTDPELIYRKRLGEGLQGSIRVDFTLSAEGKWRILARVRGMSALERSTYTTGWAPSGDPGKGSFDVIVNGKNTGKINVNDYDWKWTELDRGAVELSEGIKTLEFKTSTAGIAIDNVLMTNDLSFIPRNPDNNPFTLPSTPSELRIEELIKKRSDKPTEWRGYSLKPPFLRLSWKSSAAPQGVRYYNIYRSALKDFKPELSNLIGSTSELFFIDINLKDAVYYYKVVAIDNWDNRSTPSEEITVDIR